MMQILFRLVLPDKALTWAPGPIIPGATWRVAYRKLPLDQEWTAFQTEPGAVYPMAPPTAVYTPRRERRG